MIVVFRHLVTPRRFMVTPHVVMGYTMVALFVRRAVFVYRYAKQQAGREAQAKQAEIQADCVVGALAEEVADLRGHLNLCREQVI